MLGECRDAVRPGGQIEADFVARIHVRPEYRGSGWNFLINFPGFLVWMPAWHGYVYKANYEVETVLTRGSDNRQIDSWTVPVRLNLRHAEFDRTWTEISWLEVGAIAFLGGLYCITYDDDVSPIVARETQKPLGDYVAQQIVSRLNQFR